MFFFFCSVSSFRALTRAETFATRANHRKYKEERRFVLPAFRGAQIFIERETPEFEALLGGCTEVEKGLPHTVPQHNTDHDQ